MAASKSAELPYAIDLPPTSFAKGKTMHSEIQSRRFARRANAPGFYQEHQDKANVRLPRKAPVPGYTGFFIGMNPDYGVSKAFGLPMELMQIPKTPVGHDPNANADSSTLSDGFGPSGRHRMGAVSLFAGMGYDEREHMMATLKMQRLTGEGKKAPFDFVPGDGLVQECHIHTDSVFHQFPPHAHRAEYMPNNVRGRLRRPKGSVNKGFAPPKPTPADAPGNKKYSIFNLPTLREVQSRKGKVTRV